MGIDEDGDESLLPLSNKTRQEEEEEEEVLFEIPPPSLLRRVQVH